MTYSLVKAVSALSCDGILPLSALPFKSLAQTRAAPARINKNRGARVSRRAAAGGLIRRADGGAGPPREGTGASFAAADD